MAAGRVIGSADEFWRLRITRVDTTGDLDFEWHEDILYREPRPTGVEEVEQWHVEAVRLDDYDMIVRVASFDDRDDADRFFERAKADLVDMTASQFEQSYLEPAAAGSASDEDEDDR